MSNLDLGPNPHRTTFIEPDGGYLLGVLRSNRVTGTHIALTVCIAAVLVTGVTFILAAVQ